MDVKVTTPIKVWATQLALGPRPQRETRWGRGNMQEAGLGFSATCGRDFWGLLASLCQEGGEEIGVNPWEAHWAGVGRSSFPPLGKGGHLAPSGERGNTGKPGTSLAGPKIPYHSPVSDR